VQATLLKLFTKEGILIEQELDIKVGSENVI